MKLSFSAYCGMSYDISGDDRAAAARFIKARRKNGQRVVKLRENRWECQEPKNCSMIPDTAGILCLDDDDDFEDDDDDDDYLTEAEYWQNENEDMRDDGDEEE